MSAIELEVKRTSDNGRPFLKLIATCNGQTHEQDIPTLEEYQITDAEFSKGLKTLAAKFDPPKKPLK